MADIHSAPPLSDSAQQQPAAETVGGYSPPPAPDTPQRTAKQRVGVYDRPKRVLGSWSPTLIFALLVGVLFLLWLFGGFHYLLG